MLDILGGFAQRLALMPSSQAITLIQSELQSNLQLRPRRLDILGGRLRKVRLYCECFGGCTS